VRCTPAPMYQGLRTQVTMQWRLGAANWTSTRPGQQIVKSTLSVHWRQIRAIWGIQISHPLVSGNFTTRLRFIRTTETRKDATILPDKIKAVGLLNNCGSEGGANIGRKFRCPNSK
jgi:hypothetical protein